MDKVKVFSIVFWSAFISFFVSLRIEIQALLIFMTVDYISGILVSLFFRNSNKTDSGAYSSSVGFKGLVKKTFIVILLYVLFYIDKMIGVNIFLTMGAIGFAINELASIVENAGLMGIEIPSAFSKAFDVLVSKEEKGDIDINE